jgi:hypothetical protein
MVAALRLLAGMRRRFAATVTFRSHAEPEQSSPSQILPMMRNTEAVHDDRSLGPILSAAFTVDSY